MRHPSGDAGVAAPSRADSLRGATSLGAACAGTWPLRMCLMSAFRLATRAWSMGRSSCVAATIARRQSQERRSTWTASLVTGRDPWRISSSRVSTPCVNSAISTKPKVAEPPLIEWAARKIVSMFSRPVSRRASGAPTPSHRVLRGSPRRRSWRFQPSRDREPYQRTRAMVASSCGGLKGLTIQPVAPARLPSAFFSALDSVVSTSMGTNL